MRGITTAALAALILLGPMAQAGEPVVFREVGKASEVGEAFREWCDWHIGPVVESDS